MVPVRIRPFWNPWESCQKRQIGGASGGQSECRQEDDAAFAMVG